MRARCWSAGLAAALTLATGCSAGADSPGSVLRYELTITLRGDGSARVEERAHVRFDGGVPLRFALAVTRERVDGIDDVVAHVDGAPARAPDVDLVGEPGGGLFWSAVARTEAAEHEFSLAYDATGVLAVSGARGVFIWPAVPEGRGAVDEAVVRLSWPEGSVPMQGPGISAPGWDAVVEAGSATFSSRDVGRERPPPLYIDLVLADTSAPEPDWQIADLRARQLAPAFVAAGLFLVVVAGGVLLMIRVRHPAVEPGAGGTSAEHVPPEIARQVAGFSSWRSGAPAAGPLVTAGLVDAERLAVARGLRSGGLVVSLIGLATLVAVRIGLQGLGPALLAVPAGLMISGAILFARGVTFPVWTRAGAEVAMLHSRRLRSSREP